MDCYKSKRLAGTALSLQILILKVLLQYRSQALFDILLCCSHFTLLSDLYLSPLFRFIFIELSCKMANPFTVEIWTLYSLGVTIFILRFFARWKVVGFRQMQADDAMAVLCLVCFRLDIFEPL